MQPSENCARLVAGFEGFRAQAYRCPAGVWTIGYGTTEGVREGDIISKAKAWERLKVDLNKFGTGVYSLCSATCTQNQFDAMVSLAYNIGLGAFGRSSVLRMHNAGNHVAAAEAFKSWNKAGGKLLPGLVNRRNIESQLYLKGSS